MFQGISNFFKRMSGGSQNQPVAIYYGGQRSGGAKYNGGLSTRNPNLILDINRVRNHARDIYHDSVQAHTVVTRSADIVIDTGLKLELTPDSKTLGITEEKAEEIANQIEESFHAWASSKKSDRTETNTFYQNQRLYAIMQQRDGEVFTRLNYSPMPDLLNPVQISFLDPGQINGQGFLVTSLVNFAQDDGIIRDSAGRETAYKVWTIDAKKQVKETQIPRVGRRSGRVFMLHGFEPEYPGQGRGLSPLAHVIQSFEKLTDLGEAHITKAINEASITLYVKPAKDAPASNVLEGTIGQKAGNIPEQVQQAIDAGESLDASVNYTPLPEATLDAPGVGVFTLQAGEDLKSFESKAQADSYKLFAEAFMTDLAASTGQPLEVVNMKFAQNFSASRATLILAWRVAVIKRDGIAADFLDPTFEAWLSEEIAAGRVSMPGWSDPRLRAAWMKHTWIGTSVPNIDPAKTAKAIEAHVKMGLTTLDREAKGLNGSDAKKNRRKLTQEYSELPPSPFENQGGAEQGNQGGNGQAGAGDDDEDDEKRDKDEKGE